MAKPILVGYDPGSSDRAPVQFGVAAARFTGAPLIIGSVHSGAEAAGKFGHELVDEDLETETGESLEHLERELRSEGIRVETHGLQGTSAAKGLHEAAEEFDAGLLVLGSTERGGVGRLLPGSTAQRLMHGAPCPIAVVPRGWEPGGGMTTIGVAFVDTPEGREALKGAHALARRAGANLRVLSAGQTHGFSKTFGGGDAMTHARTYEDVGSAIRAKAEQAIADATAGTTDVEVEADVSVGDPADFLIAASEFLDLLVCGSRGYGPTRAVLLGGVSRRVTSEAQCPVIVLARGAEDSLEALVDEEARPAG
jgi:nucleotide-binding universal stress UspA family protein